VNLFTAKARDELLRLFAERPLIFPSGVGWSYSSPAYVLLAHLVEHVSGEPYGTFLRRRIFAPVGMASTGIGTKAPSPANQALGYAHEQPMPSFELDTVGIGAGDIWSTTRDLVRWDAALNTPGRLLSEASLRAMFTPQTTKVGGFAGITDASYGYGWFVAQKDGHRIQHHPGDNAGFVALNLQLPDDESVIVLLANDQTTDLSQITSYLLHELLEEGKPKGSCHAI
jgi:CubicO group peptidase (beta-lactamase class C family)